MFVIVSLHFVDVFSKLIQLQSLWKTWCRKPTSYCSQIPVWNISSLPYFCLCITTIKATSVLLF